MSPRTMLAALLVVGFVFVAACSKSSDNSSSSSASSTATESSASSGSSSSSALPITLDKLPSLKVAAGDASEGAKVFSANCESCHGAGGKNGQVGPSLYDSGVKAGQVAYMVTNPQGVDKDSGMPKLPLTTKQIADVAAYVASLK